MEKQSIIPEDTKKRKLIIIQQFNLSIIDLMVLLVFFAIGGFICWITWGRGGWIPVLGVFVAIVFCGLGVFLNTNSKIHQKKIYAVIFDSIIFYFINKKYKIDTKRDTKKLVPYKKIEDDFIVLKNNKYMSILKINGNSFFDFEPIKRENILSKVWEIKASFEKYGASIIKLEEVKSKNKTLFFLEEKKNFWLQKRKNNEINDKQLFSRIKLLDKEIIECSNTFLDTNNINSSWIEKSIYLAFFEEDRQAIESIQNKLIIEFKRADIEAVPLSGAKKINTINKILNMNIFDDSETNIYQHKENLENYLAFQSLKNKASSLKIENDENKYLFAVGTVINYQVEPKIGWINEILNCPGPVIVNFEKVNENAFQETLAKARRSAIANFEGTSKKEILTQRKRQQEVARLEQFADIIGYGADKLYKFNIHIVNKGVDSKELKENIDKTKKILKEIKLSLFINPFNQIEALSAVLPKPTDPLMDTVGREIPLYTLCCGMIYSSSSLNDDEGWYIGKTIKYDELLYLNSHIRNKERLNANAFIISLSGGGKTTSMQKMLINEILNGNKVYIIDPENEYSNIAGYFGESKIFLGNGNGIYKINPLQIMPTISDFQNEEEQENLDYNKDFWNITTKDLIVKNLNLNEMLIQNHQSVIEILFRTFYKEITEEDVRFLKNNFWYFYIEWVNKAKNKNILKWKNKDFPILQDFYNWLFMQEINDEELKLWERLIGLLEDGFVTNNEGTKKGTYSMFYNGYTSINVSDKYLTVFDMSSLKENADTKLLSMQMFLVIKLIERQVKINHELDPKTAQRIVIDEAHLLIDEDFPIALDFIYRMVKMIRKRNGGITIITQNPEEFVSEPSIEKKTKAIINNSQYALIMKSTNKNINLIENLYLDSNGFTKQEKNDLLNAESGQGLLITSKNRRFFLKFDVSKEDFEIIKGEEEPLKEWTINHLSTRIFNTIGGLKALDINSDNVVEILDNEDKKILKLKLKNQHNLNESLFNNFIEVEEVHVDKNVLEIVFTKAHWKVAVKFKDKINKKL